MNAKRTSTFSGPAARNLISRFVDIITKQPVITLVIMTLVTGIMFFPATNIGDNIDKDMSANLPENGEDKKILLELQEDWTLDVLVIVVETTNDQDNITDRNILMEMSKLEGDDEHTGLNHARGDGGREDGIYYIVSISVIFKELNSTSPRVINALEHQFLDISNDDDLAEQTGTYAIPDQDRIDRYVDQLGDDILEFVADKNGDGIWDVAKISVAISPDCDMESMIDTVDDAIRNRDDPGNGDTDTNDTKTKMTVTGKTKIVSDLNSEGTRDLSKMLTIGFVLIILVLFMFHRTFKILPIVALPIIFSLIVTFGIVSIMDIELTMIIFSTGLILIALVVAYVLHLVNRIAEENGSYGERIKKALDSTGVAIAMSIVTTIIGFAALLISSLSPMQTVGLTLCIGTALSLIIINVMVPCLVIILNYEKKQAGEWERNVWERIGEFPVKHSWSVLGVALMLTIFSILNAAILTDTEGGGEEEFPEGIESIEKWDEVAEYFEEEGTGMAIVRGDVRELDVLDGIDALQEEFATLDRVASTRTIVDIFKAAHINFTFTLPATPFLPSQTVGFTGSYWDFIHLEIHTAETRSRAIEIFYESLSNEFKRILINEDYTKTLLMIGLRDMSVDEMKVVSGELNRMVDVANNNGLIPGGSITHITGSASVFIAINDAIAEAQMNSMLLSLVFVLIALVILFRSPRIGSITILPVLIAVAWLPMSMVSTDSNMSLFTAMISAIVIGVGIDFSIHVSERIREEGETLDGVKSAVKKTGPSLVEATATTVAGLTGGLFASFPMARNFYGLIIMLLIYCMLAGLLILPAIYTVIIEIRERRNDDNKFQRNI